jgi:hypothetical protein
MGMADKVRMRCGGKGQRRGAGTGRNANVLHLMAGQCFEEQRRPAAVKNGNRHGQLTPAKDYPA